MSILLDALKKSEKQRHLGQTPTLETHFEDQLPADGTPNRWILLSLVVLSVFVMAWFGWQQLRVPEGVAATIHQDVTPPTVEATPEPVNETAGSRTMTESYQAASDIPASAGGKQQAVAEESEAARSRLSRSVSEFTAEKAPPNAQAGASASVAEPRPAPTSAASKKPRTSSAKPPAAQVARQQESRRSGVQPHIAEPISYWELPQGIRDNLGEIKITVMVYAEQSKDRFLLANGQRFAEKDELQSGLVLDEIRRDGAVFMYRKYRFLVKG